MFTITSYSSGYVLTAVISVFVALNVYRRRNVTGGKSLALMMFGITEWAFFGAVELYSFLLQLKKLIIILMVFET